MRSVFFLILLACTSVRADEWSPPDNPNPQAILQEARADTRAKRFEVALAKHVWFHEKALTVEPSLYGVRLSFALSYWLELADEYPPALAKLKEIRDRARADVMAGKNIRESFHDMVSLNKHLDEDRLTSEVFIALEEKDSKSAKKLIDLAQPSLVRTKSYSLVGKLISPEKDFARMREIYEHGKKLADDDRFGKQHLDFANKKFESDATTLVAILVVTDRKKEAEEIAASARAQWDNRLFHASLDKALQGTVPDPWP